MRNCLTKSFNIDTQLFLNEHRPLSVCCTSKLKVNEAYNFCSGGNNLVQ